VSNNVSKDELVIMPAYWFLYNMYALARNSWKYVDRDKRKDKPQLIEYDFLAPDSINEIINAIKLIEKYAGKKLLSSKKNIDELEIPSGVFENSKRKTKLIKVSQAYNVFKEMVMYHAIVQLVQFIEAKEFKNLDEVLKSLPSKNKLSQWTNVGGQLIKQEELKKMITEIHSGKINDWEQIHEFYKKQGENYAADKLHHAMAALNEIHDIDLKKTNKAIIKKLLLQSVATKQWMVKNIHDARSKDYANPFRKMVYESAGEMDIVAGKLSDNSFINQEKEALKEYKKCIEGLIKKMKL
jgi:hypothetical protein